MRRCGSPGECCEGHTKICSEPGMVSCMQIGHLREGYLLNSMHSLPGPFYKAQFSVQALDIAVPVGVPSGDNSDGSLGLMDAFTWQEVAQFMPELGLVHPELSLETGHGFLPNAFWQPVHPGQTYQQAIPTDALSREPSVLSLPPNAYLACISRHSNDISAPSLRPPDWCVTISRSLAAGVWVQRSIVLMLPCHFCCQTCKNACTHVRPYYTDLCHLLTVCRNNMATTREVFANGSPESGQVAPLSGAAMVNHHNNVCHSLTLAYAQRTTCKSLLFQPVNAEYI